MKKIIAIMAVTIFIVVLGIINAHAFTVKGEEQVLSTPTHVVPPVASKNSNEAINKLSSEVKNLENGKSEVSYQYLFAEDPETKSESSF